MAQTLVATLSAIAPPVWSDLFFQKVNKPIVTGIATVHDMTDSQSLTVNFPILSAVAPTKTAEAVATSFTALSPVNASTTAYEIQVAVELTKSAQVGSPIRSVQMLSETLMDGLAKQIETDLVAAATSGPVDSVSSNVTALSLSVIRTARAVQGGYPENIVAWVLNPTGEQALQGDAGLQQAMQYGAANGPAPVQTGLIPSLYGGPVFVTPFAPVNTSAMVSKNTIHLGILRTPTIEVMYDANTRSDKIVASAIVAVKYVPNGSVNKGCIILHS